MGRREPPSLFAATAPLTPLVTQFEPDHNIDVVKWLIHPDIDLEDGLLEGWAERLGKRARVLQLAAHSGWGRTDLPAKLPDIIKDVSWYKVSHRSSLSCVSVAILNNALLP